jgi:ribosomal-protein-alanine N-acetyltransferase
MTSATRQENVHLRPLTVVDLPTVMQIEEELFAPDMWTEAMLREELGETSSRYYLVAEVEGEIAGYGGFVDYREEGHIATLGVRKAFQGKGIGAQLLDALLAEADRRVTRVLLEVRADSPVAMRLYRGRGFTEIGRRPNYYPFSGADAVVMGRE